MTIQNTRRWGPCELTESAERRLVEAIRTGEISIAVASTRFGVSREIVQRIASKHGVTFKRGGRGNAA